MQGRAIKIKRKVTYKYLINPVFFRQRERSPWTVIQIARIENAFQVARGTYDSIIKVFANMLDQKLVSISCVRGRQTVNEFDQIAMYGMVAKQFHHKGREERLARRNSRK